MYESKYPHLFSPIQLGNTLFRNRIFGAPTGYQDLAEGKFPTPAAAAYYSRKAQGGAAAVAVGECVVDSGHGRGGMFHVQLDNPGVLGPLSLVAEGISQYGAVAVAELQHAGMYAGESHHSGNPVYGPVKCNVSGGVAHADELIPVEAMTEEIIEYTIEKFADAAAFAKRCGFGMVLMHGGHGWLLSQFLSPIINTRDDRWGGSLENRVRLPIAIAQRIREKCGRGFPIEMRLSATEANADGYDLDEGVKIAMALDGHVDLIHASAGNHEVRDAFVITHPSMFLPDGCNAYLAAEIKKHVKTPVATVGAFTEPELMEETIASGRADIIEVARELLVDPDMPNKARDGRDGDITRCIRCFTCFSNLIQKNQFCCALNPETGVEQQISAIAPAKTAKNVLIAGGGVAGMQAALTASARGHRVTLCEKTGQLGGALRCERDVPFKDKLSEYLDMQAKRVADAGVDIRLNTEVTAALAESLKPDVVIAAIGARPVKPAIKGIGGKNVAGAEDVYVDTALAGKRVVILGGGLVGTELAIYLAGLDKQVAIVELLPELSDGGNNLHAIALDVQLRERKIDVRLSTKALEITENGVLVQKPDGSEELLSADTVIYAVGQKPLWDKAEELRSVVPEFYQIGDCVAPKNVRVATQAAYFTASKI